VTAVRFGIATLPACSVAHSTSDRGQNRSNWPKHVAQKCILGQYLFTSEAISWRRFPTRPGHELIVSDLHDDWGMTCRTFLPECPENSVEDGVPNDRAVTIRSQVPQKGGCHIWSEIKADEWHCPCFQTVGLALNLCRLASDQVGVYIWHRLPRR